MVFIVLMYVCMVLIALCLYPRWLYRRARKFLSPLPCLPTLPVIGNLHQLLGDGVHILTRLTIVSKTMDYKRSPLVFWLGPIPTVGVCDLVDVTTVTNTYAPSLSPRVWKHTFKRPGVSTTNEENLQEIFNVQAQKLAAQLKTEFGKEPFDASQKYIAYMALETFCQITFGIPIKGLTKEDFQSISKASELYLGKSINVPFLLSFLYGLTPVSRDLIRDEDVLKKLVEKMINKTKKEAVSDNINGMLTQKKIVSDLTTAIGAGHKIIANAITMCLLIVGSQTDIQEKLHKEIKDILGDENRSMTKDDLAKMQYCEAVVYETLRLYPFVPLYFLHANKDLDLNKCTIPKDTTCWVNIWGAGRSRNLWGAEVDSFRPERWENHDKGFLMTYYFDNFIGLGMELSLAMLKTTLAQCVRELVIQSNTRNLRFKMSTALEPINGHLIRVLPRNY